MVYAANEKIAFAFSKSPLGLFKNSSKTHYQSDFKEIDPFIFLTMVNFTYTGSEELIKAIKFMSVNSMKTFPSIKIIALADV